MTAKKSFLIILRISFILFSLFFVNQAFYKWDGYSYYMRFTDFLPHLSLAFILWTIPGMILAFAFWLIVCGFSKTLSKLLRDIRFEDIMACSIFVVVIILIKIIFFSHVSITELTGLNNFIISMIGIILVVIVARFGHNIIGKILYELDTRIKPLFWIFIFLLIIALPFSVFSIISRKPPTAKYASDNIAFQDKKFPNIILVTMDTLTARDMQVYGYHRPTTPFISEWARDAILFKRAYSGTNWTTPSTMSLMTGQRIWTHGIWYYAYNSPVKDYLYNLPKILRDNGYKIYGFVQNDWANPDTLGIGESFLTKDSASSFRRLPNNWVVKNLVSFFMNRPIVNDFINKYPVKFKREVKKLLQSFRGNAVNLTTVKKSYALNHAESVTLNNQNIKKRTTISPPDIVYDRFFNSVLLTQKEQKDTQPFFAWVHTFPPHDPYLPPRLYWGTYGDAEYFNYVNRISKYNPEDQGKVDILRKRYDEFILYSDEQFRLFMDRLSKSVDMSNTIIIFTSDHGELFSHGYQGHSDEHLYEPLVHIPLIIKLPEINSGKIIDMPVELTDVAPTILELVGIQAPEWMEGRSLLPLLEGNQLESRPIFSMQLIRNRSFGHPISKGTFAVWEGDYKLIYYLDEEKSLLFNLKQDPDELNNLFKKKPEIGKRLFNLIQNNLKKANERIIRGK